MNAISTFPTRKAPASLTLLRAAPVATRGRRSGLANARPSPQSQPNEAGHRVDVGFNDQGFDHGARRGFHQEWRRRNGVCGYSPLGRSRRGPKVTCRAARPMRARSHIRDEHILLAVIPHPAEPTPAILFLPLVHDGVFAIDHKVQVLPPGLPQSTSNVNV